MISSSPRADGFSSAAMSTHLVVVEVEPGDGVVRLRLLRLLLDARPRRPAVELHHAVTLGILHLVAEDRGAVRCARRALQQRRQARRRRRCCRRGSRQTASLADELRADDERLREPVRAGCSAYSKCSPHCVPSPSSRGSAAGRAAWR